jgi:dGTPase
VRAGVPLFRTLHEAAAQKYPNAAPRLPVYEALRRMLNAFVSDLIAEVHRRVQALGAVTGHEIGLADIRRAPARQVGFSPEIEAARAAAKKFLYENFYNSPNMEDVHRHAERVVTDLFGTLMAEPQLMPEDHQAQIPSEGLARTVTDYLAGMTDSYIEQLWARTR